MNKQTIDNLVEIATCMSTEVNRSYIRKTIMRGHIDNMRMILNQHLDTHEITEIPKLLIHHDPMVFVNGTISIKRIPEGDNYKLLKR